MSYFTFLTEEQIFGDYQLDIIKKYGTKCEITDFSILLGGYVSTNCYTTFEGASRINLTGWWWTKTLYYNDARIVDGNGNSRWNAVYSRDGGARPALPYSSISSISSNVGREKNGILEVEYGEYPQTIVSEDFSLILERAYSNRTINQTGKSYTTDSVKYKDKDTSFQAKIHIEYEYNGRKYIRFVGDSNCDGEVLSDGRTIQNGSPYWIEVEPIKWMIDERTNIALSKKIIFSGVQFNRRSNYKGDFNRTDIEKFMNKIFSRDIIPSNIEQKLNMSYQLNDEAKANISRVTGLSYDELINMDLESIEKCIEQKFMKKPTYDLRIKVDGIPIDECHVAPIESLDERMNQAISGPKRRIRKC